MAETKSTANKGAAPAAAGPRQGNPLAVASLVTGIVAIVFGWVFFFGFLVGATAIVLGIIALKKSANDKGKSIAGIITGAAGALWSLVISVFFVIGLVALSVGGATAGAAIHQANQALANYNADNKALIDAKKDFAKGDTAKFGQFEVKVNSVQRNYDASSQYYTVADGNELIVVNVTVKNTGADSKYIGAYDLKINDSGTANTSAYVSITPAFNGGDVSPGASLTGNLSYEVKKDSTDLKLQYDVLVYDLNGGGAKTLTFTLPL